MQRPSQGKREKIFSENPHLPCNDLANSFRISRSLSKDVVVFSMLLPAKPSEKIIFGFIASCQF